MPTPDWFRFAGFRSHRLRQIGNAVPPLLAKAIAEMLMEQLKANT
ncbi:MAG TPA: DNA cytosine methyltransferase [Symbiobacteriaceae bacterium]